MMLPNRPSWLLFFIVTITEIIGADDDYNVLHRDGSYEFGYNNPDSYHYEDANRNNVVKGEFGARNPATGAIDSTIYTAGPRGFRPRGKNIVRKYDLNQNGPRPVGSPDDPYYDPFDDPSYNFSFRTRTYNRQESANRLGDVNGRYSYVDDVGERHNVEFIAGKNTGFHVKTPFPDSNPRAYGSLFFNGRGKPISRGRTSIQRGLDGSYRFVSSGPDQRRTETSDSTGHVRGSYTYLDDKGVQHSVHYIAGPETGYRVLKNVKGPHLPTVFPFGRPNIIPPDFYDDKDGDVFDTAASGHVKPIGGKPRPSKPRPGSKDDEVNFTDEKGTDMDSFISNQEKPLDKPSKPTKPSFSGISGGGDGSPYDEDDDFGDIFGGDTSGSSTTSKPKLPTSDQGAYKPNLSSKEEDRPSGFNVESTPEKPKPTSEGKPDEEIGGRPSIQPQTTSGVGYEDSKRPSPSFDSGYGFNEVNNGFGLFGSESSNARPPYGGRPVINVGGTGESCPKCQGTIVTNVGDRLFTVPPGVSVRAHVQAIDLIPISPNVPSPREQYNADISLKTEQLNEVDANSTEIKSVTTTYIPEVTTIVPSTNSTTT